MNSITTIIIIITIGLITTIIGPLSALIAVKNVNARYSRIVKEIEKKVVTSGYFVYGAQSRRKTILGLFMCEMVGWALLILIILVEFMDPWTTVQLIGTTLISLTFIFFIPVASAIFLLITGRKVLFISPLQLEIWKHKKELTSNIKSIEWSNIKRAWINLPKYYGLGGKDGYMLVLLLRPKGRLIMWGDWINVKLLLKDILRYATSADFGDSELFIRRMARDN